MEVFLSKAPTELIIDELSTRLERLESLTDDERDNLWMYIVLYGFMNPLNNKKHNKLPQGFDYALWQIENKEDNMVFSCNPINPFQNDGLSKEDRAMINGMRETAYICGCRGEDVEHTVYYVLRKIGRYDLLPPCERGSEA